MKGRKRPVFDPLGVLKQQGVGKHEQQGIGKHKQGEKTPPLLQSKATGASTKRRERRKRAAQRMVREETAQQKLLDEFNERMQSRVDLEKWRSPHDRSLRI